MPTTPPEDIDDMFDLPPLPESAQSAESTLEAAEAALAAELASTLDAHGVAGDAPDSRTDLRVAVSWPARMQLPDGRVIDVRVRNVSEGGVGLMSAEPIPGGTVVDLEMRVPPFDQGDESTTVTGTIKTTYTVAQGAEILCGSTWQAAPAGLEIVSMWIERLRR